MPSKDFIVDENLAVTVYKRRGSRNLSLRIVAGGNVRVTIPAWVSYKTGVDFAKSKQEWILKHKTNDRHLLHGQAVGKSHHLRFNASISASSVKSRVMPNEIFITYPIYENPLSQQVQRVAQEASVKALRLQAEQLLPQRIAELAAKHGFKYGSISVKRLKSRWGSCDQNKNIALNLFLMQLPWQLIDYVILHELVHTQVLKHGPDFWKSFSRVCNDPKALRKQMRSYRPIINGAQTI
ncbi:MAG TPA: SprT family zinc-dependent metalloprotease [Candidatus Saccharimonadales bacterium]|nr:SprT family zinc-dependent metalloprotease [Candidatus Saccharimonadales bacterium]